MLVPGLHEGPGQSMGEDVDSGEKIDREPRMHIKADLRSEKFSLHLSQCKGRAVCSPLFLRQERGQSLVHDSCNGAHTFCG